MSDLALSVVLDGDRVLQLPPMAATVDVATVKMMIEMEVSEIWEWRCETQER
jgi:hypothetical protein